MAGFADGALTVAREAGELSDLDERWATAELERIRTLAKTELGRLPANSADQVLSEFLFTRLGFVREVTDTSLRFVLLPGVLRQRRGSCVGLSSLLLAVAEALGRSANGVLMPGHFYVRLGEHGSTRNVELLRQGEAMSNAWYTGRFPIAGGGAARYARALGANESLGVIEYDVGKERRRQLRLEEARGAFARSVRLFPQFAEAHASLGATLHLLGRLDDAARSYHAARTLDPLLPGVDWNIELLERELAFAVR